MIRLTTFGEWVEIWRLPEFGPPWWTPVVIFGLMVLVFAVLAALLMVREGRVEPVGWGIVLFMGTYAAFRSRAIPYFVLAVTPLLALAFVTLAVEAQARTTKALSRRWENSAFSDVSWCSQLRSERRSHRESRFASVSAHCPIPIPRAPRLSWSVVTWTADSSTAISSAGTFYGGVGRPTRSSSMAATTRPV